MMRFTDLRAGYRCQNRCRFCDQGDARVRLGDASFEAVRTAMQGIPHREGLILAGGEVTLRGDLPRLVATARALGFRRVAIQTNGRILAAKGACSGLREAGLTDATIALHAPRADLHDWITREPGSWRQAVAGATACVAAGITLRLATVVVRSNYTLLPLMLPLGSRVSASGLRFVLCREEGEAGTDARALVPRLSLVAEPLAAGLDEARQRRVEAEVVGMPLCLLGEHRAAAADRRDGPPLHRVHALEDATPHAPGLYPSPCQECAVRAACPGLDPRYFARYGAEELRPVGATGVPAPPASVTLEMAPTDTGRTLRQRLVKARATGATAIHLVGEHPEAAALHKEATRLGFTEVSGPQADRAIHD